MTIWYHEGENGIMTFIFYGKRRGLSSSYREKMIRGGHLINSGSGELNGVDRKCPNPAPVLRVASWTYDKFTCPPWGCKWLLLSHCPYTLSLFQTSQLHIPGHLLFSAFQYLFSLLMPLSQVSFPTIPAHNGHDKSFPESVHQRRDEEG